MARNGTKKTDVPSLIRERDVWRMRHRVGERPRPAQCTLQKAAAMVTKNLLHPVSLHNAKFSSLSSHRVSVLLHVFVLFVVFCSFSLFLLFGLNAEWTEKLTMCVFLHRLFIQITSISMLLLRLVSPGFIAFLDQCFILARCLGVRLVRHKHSHPLYTGKCFYFFNHRGWYVHCRLD